jgi:hypothetical protein
MSKRANSGALEEIMYVTKMCGWYIQEGEGKPV